MSLLDVLLWSLAVIPIVSWIVSAILGYRALLRPYIAALVERAVVSVLGSVASTVIAVLVINSYWRWFHLDSPWSLALIAVALLLLEIPSLIWIVLYLTVWRPDR